VAVVFALGIEAGSFTDRISALKSIRGDGPTFHQGTLDERPIVAVTAGAGLEAADRATRAVVDAHRPRWVIAAGLAGGLDERLARGDLLLADAITNADGQSLKTGLTIDPAELQRFTGVHLGRLLSWGEMVRTPARKSELGRRFDALAVDMESFAVAETCRALGVPMLAVRAIGDPVDEQLPDDVDRLLRQTSEWARWGAAAATVWRRFGALKDLYRLRENTLIATEKLADFLVAVIGQLRT
jgi:adenosylhomocysteine nucleosidase